MDKIVERIKVLMEKEQMTAAEFADQLGIGRPLLSHVLGGRNNPSLQLILKILSRFPNYDADWLLLGNEVSENKYSKKEEETSVELPTRSHPQKIVSSGINSNRVLLFYQDGTYDEYNPRK